MRILHSSTKKKQTAAQEQVQSEKDCFPYQKAYKNGIIRLADQTYAKMYAVPDTQKSADVKKMFLNLLVSFGTRIHIQQTAYCRNVAAEESVQLLYKFFIVSAEADSIDTARHVVGFAAGRGSDVGIILEMYTSKRNEFEGISGSKNAGVL